MSQGFRFKFDQMRDGNPTRDGPRPADGPDGKVDYYETEGHVRNICFILLDGNRISFDYSHLIYREFHPADNKIILAFSSHTVILNGLHLESLFNDILCQMVRQISCVEERYNPIDDTEKPIVNGIDIQINN